MTAREKKKSYPPSSHFFSVSSIYVRKSSLADQGSVQRLTKYEICFTPHFFLLLLLQLCDFLEQHFLDDSHETIKKLGDYIGSLTRLTASETQGPMGEYLFDKHTL